ncbi:Small-subunit processome, Utp [Parasponia andersonii]|uniref:Small-subunit processome, Utp n=1 Tax=Parasponia andersonii TaxID=3476 RepID=A0A2P5D275_PARAD|nr:Small-subunit processome, Utp [Parasponia andersonii]
MVDIDKNVLTWMKHLSLLAFQQNTFMLPSPTTRNCHGEAAEGVLGDEPTMGEKLVNLLEKKMVRSNECNESSLTKHPSSADSVHALLKQALRADNHAVLLDCLYIEDEKDISKSISLLNPSDVLKQLRYLVSVIQSRGAVLACALPWLRCLLLQHASGIMSQEYSLLALNSLYQRSEDSKLQKDSSMAAVSLSFESSSV